MKDDNDDDYYKDYSTMNFSNLGRRVPVKRLLKDLYHNTELLSNNFT